jgi:hypothetical protein
MPQPKLLTSQLDSPERSSPEELEVSRLKLQSHEVVAQLLEGFPELAVILDKNRHIVAHNGKAAAIFASLGGDEAFGKRLGEALGCARAKEIDGGCGASRFCAECGATRAVSATKESGVVQSRDCRILTMLVGKEGSLNLRVVTSPLHIDGEIFTLFTFKDIAHEKRLEALERIFFHDVLNTAAAINSISSLMEGVADESERKDLVALLRSSAWQLINEIHSQRDLLTAERGELAFVVEPVTTARIVSSVYELYKSHDLAHGKMLTFTPLRPDATVETGVVHLVRCLGNLVKNALEASEPGQQVRLDCEQSERHVVFHIHSEPVMPEDVQRQVFQRSFSTKAPVGRGLGTYSVRLLVEQYLQGHVWFESNAEVGTVFSVKLPKKFKRK